MIPSFKELTRSQDMKLKRKPVEGFFIALDPGETTGVAIFEDTRLINATQIKTSDLKDATILLNDVLTFEGINQIIVEDYRVYSWRSKQHEWSNLHTPKLIGSIEALCALKGIPCEKQMAHNVKGFVTDSKLKAWDMYRKGKPHARDAIRHGCYFRLFKYFTGQKEEGSN